MLNPKTGKPFRMTVNRPKEIVQLLGPVLYHRNPLGKQQSQNLSPVSARKSKNLRTSLNHTFQGSHLLSLHKKIEAIENAYEQNIRKPILDGVAHALNEQVELLGQEARDAFAKEYERFVLNAVSDAGILRKFLNDKKQEHAKVDAQVAALIEMANRLLSPSK